MTTRRMLLLLLGWGFLAGGRLCPAGEFLFPTANRALLEPGAEARFFAPTPGKTWRAGSFGCTRTEGTQLHEGIDILCLQRDRRGEPLDPVLATAPGIVAYVNARSSLSNYGKYLVLYHLVDGIEVYSLYAHLSRFEEGIRPGTGVVAGQVLGIMGRTANTAQSIARDRAHLHFELNLVLNDEFPAWYRRTFPGQRNDHGVWNGQNLAALDAQEILLLSFRHGTNFNLAAYLRAQPELCRVRVRQPDLFLAGRYTPLLDPNPTAGAQGVAGYEIALSFAGVPVRLIPRAASELPGHVPSSLVSVNAAEQRARPCRGLVTRRGGGWELTSGGQRLVSLLGF